MRSIRLAAGQQRAKPEIHDTLFLKVGTEESAISVAQFKHRRRARWWIGGGAVALLLVGLWLADSILLPIVVRQKFAASLENLSGGPVSFHLDHTSLWGSQFSRVRVAGLEVPLLSVAYQPWAVIRGHLDSIDVIGARITVNGDDPGLPGTSGAKPTQGSSAATGSGSLPFKTINLSSCLLVLKAKGKELQTSFDASLSPSVGGASSVDLTGNVLNTPLKLSGSFDAAHHTADLALKADGLEVAAIMAVLPPISGLESIHAGGTLSINGHYILGPRGQGISASLNGVNGWLAARAAGRVVVARQIKVQISGDLGNSFQIDSLNAEITSPILALDQNFTAAATFHVRSTSDHQFNFDLNLDSPQFDLELDKGNVMGLLNAAEQIQIASDIRIRGYVPPSLSDTLLRKGIDVSELGRGLLVGKVKAQLPGIRNADRQAWRGELSAGNLSLARTASIDDRGNIGRSA